MIRFIRGLVAYDRDQLIKRYTTLLDEVEQYRSGDGDREAELEILSKASNLIGATLGGVGRISFDHPDDARTAVASALMSWQSAFGRRTDTHFWDEVISELMRLKFGDQPEMLKPAFRKQNQHPQGGRVMFMRLTAVGWQEFFRKNYPNDADNYQTEIAEAYGVQFDTIQKWRVRVKKFFGSDFFSGWLAHASSGEIEGFTSLEYKDFLKNDGRRYQELSLKSEQEDE